jgi:hypothetical protein
MLHESRPSRPWLIFDVRQKMKTLLITLTLAWCSSACAEDILLGDTKSTHQRERYVWAITRERLERAPAWKKGSPPPLSPDKAEEIAYDWSRRQRLAGRIPERPYRISLVAIPSFENRYFYKVAFVDVGGDSFWTVHILLDGFVVEPKAIEPNKAPEPTPGSVTLRAIEGTSK